MQQPIALAAAFFAVGGMAQWSYTDCSQLLGGSGYVSPSTLSFPSIPGALSLTHSPLIIIIIINNPLPHNHLISLITKNNTGLQSRLLHSLLLPTRPRPRGRRFPILRLRRLLGRSIQWLLHI